jgi:predicted nucleic acid-binding protein
MVICDSSPLIHLAGIGRLGLLRELYGKLIVPTAVWREIVEEGKGRPGVIEVQEARLAGWIEVRSTTQVLLLRSLKQELDDGEAEVISLAVELNASLVLLDETEARRVAGLYDLNKTGAIGVLIRSRLEGKLEALRPELDKIRNEAGFWIEGRLYLQALAAVGEEPGTA